MIYISMSLHWSLLLFIAIALVSSVAQAAVVEHTFNVGNFSISQLCQPPLIITAVNGQLPGPTIYAREGDTVVVHLVNTSPYSMTLHWHGVLQRGTPWADGPAMVTQCPVQPGGNYTYRFNVDGQEGTLWWHAHVSFHRATVYGALVIRPRGGAKAYPFPKPDKEHVVILGEWWNATVYDMERMAFLTGIPAPHADAYTINGKPGDLYNCSAPNQTAKFEVRQNGTYLLRIINAGMNTPLFFKVAKHRLTVVGADACYTKPYKTDVVVVSPGQTVDALMVASAGQRHGHRAPVLLRHDRAAAPRQAVGGAARRGHPHPEQLLCNRSAPPVFSSSMNNASFVVPKNTSLLEAHFRREPAGVYTRDFPDTPPVVFDYTGDESDNATMQFTTKSTKVKTLRYNETVEMVLQNTRLIAKESHPMHIHGFNFFILAQGFGNYDKRRAERRFNLVDPQERNTIAVPTGGWAVIRFVADNPGMWYMHCHFDAHISLGLAMVLEVLDGPTPETSVPPPPADLPRCS
uniref:laccase n=1 Tax=Oryza barthii TaxID=65489 RepID=A0A0D3HT08_9ORYZ